MELVTGGFPRVGGTQDVGKGVQITSSSTSLLPNNLTLLNRWPTFSLTVVTNCTSRDVDYGVSAAGEDSMRAVRILVRGFGVDWKRNTSRRKGWMREFNKVVGNESEYVARSQVSAGGIAFVGVSKPTCNTDGESRSP